MSSSRDLLACGITTQALAAGASIIINVTDQKYVVGRYLFSGSTLATIAGNTAAVPTMPLPYPAGLYIDGPAPFAVFGATVNCITYLTQGFGATLGY